MWAEQIPDIGAIYRVIAPDLRGHGDSPAPEGVYTMDEMADDVIDTLDALHIREPIVLGRAVDGRIRGAFARPSLSRSEFAP